MANLCSLLGSLVILMSMLSSASGIEECFRVTAAVTYDEDQIYLISNDKYIKLNSTLGEIKSGEMSDEFGGPEGAVEAALIFAGDGTLYFFQGNSHFEYSAFWGSTGSADDNSDFGTFFEGGIDAAATVGSDSYFFKGCEYTMTDGTSGRNVDELDLPCDIEAALGHDGNLYLIKGEEVWIRNSDGEVHGPEDISSVVTLTSTTICPANPHTARVRAEQAYEGEHNCAIIDAAITWDDVVYLFNDDSYVSLDSEGNEDGGGPNSEWGYLSSNIDAGIVWSGNDRTYFFKGSDYYKYFWGHSLGPLSGSLWAPFFEDATGIDAAGNHNGKSYFFKGCEIALYEGPQSEVTAMFSNTDFNLPCNVHAAFSREGTMYVVKYDQVWTWRTDEETATGPANLSTVAELTTWTACQEGST